MDILVRAFDAPDIDDVLAIFRQPRCIHGTLQTPYQNPQNVRDRFAESDPSRRQLVAVVRDEERERVVGMLGLQRGSGRRDHAADLGMFVHDDYQNRRVGTALVEAAVDLADNWLGLRRLELQVYTDNEAGIRLYEKFGFEREGTLRAYALRDGEYVDAYTMARLASAARQDD